MKKTNKVFWFKKVSSKNILMSIVTRALRHHGTISEDKFMSLIVVQLYSYILFFRRFDTILLSIFVLFVSICLCSVLIQQVTTKMLKKNTYSSLDTCKAEISSDVIYQILVYIVHLRMQPLRLDLPNGYRVLTE